MILPIVWRKSLRARVGVPAPTSTVLVLEAERRVERLWWTNGITNKPTVAPIALIFF